MDTVKKSCDEPELPLHSENGEGIAVKTRDAEPAEAKPSPIESYAATIAMMAENRALLEGLRPNDSNWITLLQDLNMLCAEGVTLGLRTPWARRVAVPLMFAHKVMSDEDEDDRVKAKKAKEILKQCSDARTQSVCIGWLEETFRV